MKCSCIQLLVPRHSESLFLPLRCSPSKLDVTPSLALYPEVKFGKNAENFLP